MTPTRAYTTLALFILLNAAISALGGWVTASSVGTWYLTLEKPSFNPPNWIFAPVWGALYVMIAIAGWRAWRRSTGPQRQLALNLSWSFVFFGARLIGPALAAIATLLNAALWRLN